VVLAGAVARRVAAELGDPAGSCLDGLPPSDELDQVALDTGGSGAPGGWADPWLVGLVHEMAASTADRRARGAWYTPRPVVDGLLALAVELAADHPLPPLVVDPTCGGGAFLLAALDRFVGAGVDPARALGRIAGLDLDPGAVQVTRWGVALWWLARSGSGPVPALDVTRGDALAPWPERWRRGPVLVIGNPPFATPLKQGTLPDAAARFRAARADVLGPYADLAAIHLLQAVEQAAPGSMVALVQPQSVLAGRDTAGLRARLASAAPLRALWAAREAVFDAGVRACAVVLDIGSTADAAGGGGPDAEVVIAHGPTVAVSGRRAPATWGELAADALGAPHLPTALTAWPAGGRGAGRLGDLATATAGFRDEHYALVAACREAAAEEDADGRSTARLATVGAVDPLHLAWGVAPIRFGRRDWNRPMVDRHALPPRIGGWLDRQLRPKVLLATQTRLLEPVVDREGIVAPATPLIAVHADADQLDRVVAVLLAPPVVAWAWRRWFGTAMTIDAVKLAARQVGELPLPPDRDRWSEAAALLAAATVGTAAGAAPAAAEPSAAPDGDRTDCAARAAAWAVAVEVARLMTEAYGASPAVFEWWRERLSDRPTRRPVGLAQASGQPGDPPEMVEARPEQVR